MNVFSGVGVDIVNVERFKKKPLKNNLNFYKKIFLDSEIKYCRKFKSPYVHFAGKFAVKEAVMKSIDEKIGFLEIHTDHDGPKPFIKLKSLFKKKYKFMVSISHEKEYAIAVVLSEKIT
tara:strand:- start:1559 stop:1915 length:357 start_codon:yes stop_codon:yes gene_type:complete